MKPRIPSFIIRKGMAAAVTAALLITAPGLQCYQAMAQTYSAGSVGAANTPGGAGMSAGVVSGISQLPVNLSLPGQIARMDLAGTLGENLRIQNTHVPGRTVIGNMLPGALPVPKGLISGSISNSMPKAVMNPQSGIPQEHADFSETKKSGIVQSLTATSAEFIEAFGGDAKISDENLQKLGKGIFDGAKESGRSLSQISRTIEVDEKIKVGRKLSDPTYFSITFVPGTDWEQTASSLLFKQNLDIKDYKYANGKHIVLVQYAFKDFFARSRHSSDSKFKDHKRAYATAQIAQRLSRESIVESVRISRAAANELSD